MAIISKNYYERSTIRKWLNADFYNTALSSTQKLNVLDSPMGEFWRGSEYCYTYYDKVFLLSKTDMENTTYGFSAEKENYYLRKANGTDYAKCQGLFVASSGCSIQRLSTPRKILTIAILQM